MPRHPPHDAVHISDRRRVDGWTLRLWPWKRRLGLISNCWRRFRLRFGMSARIQIRASYFDYGLLRLVFTKDKHVKAAKLRFADEMFDYGEFLSPRERLVSKLDSAAAS